MLLLLRPGTCGGPSGDCPGALGPACEPTTGAMQQHVGKRCSKMLYNRFNVIANTANELQATAESGIVTGYLLKMQECGN